MNTATNTNSQKKVPSPSAKQASARVNRSINKLEDSMDRLVSHVSQTRTSVEHAKDVMQRPGRWARRGVAEVKKEPALYFAIAWGLGLIYWTSTRLATVRRAAEPDTVDEAELEAAKADLKARKEEIFIVKKAARRRSRSR